MFTISNIISDIDKGCMANNMVEDMFTFRIIFFVNEGNKGFKYHIDSTYHDLRRSLEGIIKNHLSLTNSLVIAQTTVLKNGKCVCLQSRAYAFSLDEYFRQINEECKDNGRYGDMCGRYAVR